MQHGDGGVGTQPEAEAPLSALASSAMARPGPWLDDLNPPQRQAVETTEGPVLMLAGAGTGKTRALTARIAHLLASGRARPYEILAVTFTNKAAREMRHRVGALVGSVVEGMPWLGTFHALCTRILRTHAELAGLQSNFTILDTDDQLRLLRQVIQAANLDEKRWPARQLAGLIDRWKNRALTPASVPPAEAGQYAGRGAELYAAYQERLRTLNAADFGDLLLHVLEIFRGHEDVLAKYQRRFRYMLVDEYQDTNVAQYLWLRLLAQAHRNLCVVGDDDQSIYGWRGAEVGNILRFEKDFPGAVVIRLEQNYRSTPHILAAASAVIAANAARLGKTLWTERNRGEKVRLIGHWDGEEEARWIGEEAEALAKGSRGLDPVPLDGQAILVRASFQMRAFEDRFLTIGLPYRVIGGPRFYERAEIRDAMAYFRVVTTPEDGLAFERIVNVPKRGLGEKAVQEMNRHARERGLPLLAAARELVASGAFPARGRQALGELAANFERWRRRMLTGEPHTTLAAAILDESGYTAMWQAEKTAEAQGRLDNLKELVKALEEFENLQGFLEHVALIMENEESEGTQRVTLMTLHAAKGLEFPAVFLPGWEDGLFPSQRSMDESGAKGLEEERRLAYVGITRAREHCTISFAANRRVYNQWQSSIPSRFIDELPKAHVEVLTPPGLWGGSAAAPARSFTRQPEILRGSELEERATKANVYNSPGWQRMAARRDQYGMGAPREVRTVLIDEGAVPAFALGARVFHQKFGYGIVAGIEGDKLTIRFEKAGEKRVVAAFVTAAGDDRGDGDVPF